MKIAMLGWEFPPFVSGGLGVHCFELSRNLAALGVEIDFFMPSTSEKPKGANGVNLIQVGVAGFGPYSRPVRTPHEAYGWNFFERVQAYNSALAHALLARKKENYSLIHSHDWITVPAAGDSARSLRLPLVSTFHSTEFDRTPWPWQLILDIEKRGAAQADRLIAVSNLMKRQLFRLGAREEKIRVVYNGVDYGRFDKKDWSEREKREKTVLFLGRLVEQKGPEAFLLAAQKVLALEPFTKFVVIGEGDLLPKLIGMSISLGISRSVSFLGHVPDEIQRSAYARSDVFIMPSVSEPFGITALEAMASGTPCIVSKSSGVSEAVKSCLRVDFWDVEELANKILELLRYPVARKSMAEAGLSEVKGFSWGKTAAETLSVYKEVMG